MSDRVVLFMKSCEPVDWLRDQLSAAGFGLVCVEREEDLMAAASMSGIALFILKVRGVEHELPELVFGLRSSRASMAPVMVMINYRDVLETPQFSVFDVDDFLFGPWSWEEIVPRILLLCEGPSLRRIGKPRGLYGFQLTRSRLAVEYAGKEVILSPSEFEIARVLVRHLGAPVSRSMMPRGARRSDGLEGGRSLDVLVSRLRKKLDSVAGADFCLRSVFRVGYKLERVHTNLFPKNGNPHRW